MDEKEMTFEEQFPTLAKIYKYGCTTFTNKCLMKTCLDKQKVGAIIDNFVSSEWDEMDEFDIWLKRELKERLGV